MAPRFPMDSPESPEAVGRRLRMLRGALKLSQDKIAASIGMASGSSSWAPYEHGRNLIPSVHAINLCRRYGITMDWLYRGIWHGMPIDLIDVLSAEEGGLTSKQIRPKLLPLQIGG